MENMLNGETPLTIKASPEYKHYMKMLALRNNMTLKELVTKALDHYEKNVINK